jgi:AraC-like DNA-binding protein
MLTYTAHAVPAAARRFVQSVWTLRGVSAGRDADPSPILPDGCVELLLNVGDPTERVSGQLREWQPSVLVAGQMTTAVTVVSRGRVDLIGVRLHPWAAGAFLRVAMHELRDRIVPADVVPVASRLLHQAGRTEEADHRLQAVLGTLEDHAIRCEAPSPTDAAMTRWAAARAANARAGALASQFGLSSRRIQQRFAHAVGMSPKQLMRITRLQRALEAARSTPHRGLAAAALASGYYDHAHLDRDCRAIAGEPPSAVLLRSGLTAAMLERGP